MCVCVCVSKYPAEQSKRSVISRPKQLSVLYLLSLLRLDKRWREREREGRGYADLAM